MRPELNAAFAGPGVVEAYQCRPPYPPEVFDVPDELITDQPRHVLDIGAGDGALARPLAERGDRVAVRRYATDGILEMKVVATITWGRPMAAAR